MRSLSLLIKPASSGCNMRCRYCFYADIADARAVKNYGIMKTDVLETLVRNALAETRGDCLFAFQGGEPTLAGLDFYRELLAFEKKYNINNSKISHALQTNGLTLDERWAEFFRENNFLVGLSVDADKNTHDFFRRDAKGDGTHARCMAVARLLTERRVEFNILSVVTKQLAAHPDSAYRFYKRGGFRFIQFIPCLDDLGDVISDVNEAYSQYRRQKININGREEASASVAARAESLQRQTRRSDRLNISAAYLDAQTYSHFLCRVFDLWYADFIKDDYVSIRAFDNYIQMLMGAPPENCAMNGVCRTYAVVEADGGVYPCDFYAADEYLLGNARTHSFTQMLRGGQAEAFTAPSRRRDPACLSCEYFYLCRGGCRRDREPVIDGAPRLNRFCEAYRKFFEHALPRMRRIAAKLQ